MVRKIRSILLAVALVATAITAGGAAHAAASCGTGTDGGEWRSYGGNLSNTRSQGAENSIGTNAAYDLETAWTYSPDGTAASGGFQSTPVVADGCVYGATASGSIVALNADTGDLVWSAKAPGNNGLAGGMFSLSVSDGRVIGMVGSTGGPYAVALDQADGSLLWQTAPLYDDQSATINASPVVYKGLLFVGMWGGDGNPDSHPPYAIVDVTNGDVLVNTPVIPQSEWADGYAGGGIWATGVVDADTDSLYVGTSNPYSKRHEHRYTNALLRIDLNRSSATFGKIVDAYKGDVDQYFPGVDRQPACTEFGDETAIPPLGYSAGCVQMDIDFGASPVLFTNDKGEKLIGNLQKSGVFHAVYADNMQRAWTSLISYPILLGNAASSAFDGHSLYVAASPGNLFALNPNDGSIRWTAPIADGAHYEPVSVANGVVYTVTTHGTLSTWDAKTGQPLFSRPFALDTGEACVPLGGGAAIARHHVYAACDLGTSGNGWIVALKWDDDAPLPALPLPY